MKILTVENNTYDIDCVPDEIDDIRYCVLDGADPEWVDFYFLPLIFLESFHAPAICLQIGEFNIQMPMDWSVLLCDEDFDSVETLPLASLNNREFRALVMNPLTSRLPNSESIEITNVYQDVKWFFPKLKNGHLLSVPLESGENPQCAFFVKDANKVKDIQVADLIS
jgi:hypothetical protein